MSANTAQPFDNSPRQNRRIRPVRTTSSLRAMRDTTPRSSCQRDATRRQNATVLCTSAGLSPGRSCIVLLRPESPSLPRTNLIAKCRPQNDAIPPRPPRHLFCLLGCKACWSAIFSRLTRSRSTNQSPFPTTRDPQCPVNGGAAGGVAASLDSAMQHALSCLVIQHGHCIVDIVEQVRGQPANDPRPNKALCPDRLGHLLVGYQHCDLICQIAQEGVTPQWQVQQFRRGQDPENHQSTTRHLQSVLRSICRGQDAGQYLVLDDTILDIWRDVHVSH
jgi:hypothetical protein